MTDKPKPKYRIGQVVRPCNSESFGKITSRVFPASEGKPDCCEYRWGYYSPTFDEWTCECELQSLTAREVGPGWQRTPEAKKTRKGGNHG